MATDQVEGFTLELAFFLTHLVGIGLLLGLAAGWLFAARTRWLAFKAAQQQQGRKKANSAGQPRIATSLPTGPGSTPSAGNALPSVALVMPAKAHGEHLLTNWQSQVLTDYKGKVQSFIVAGSSKDPAYAAATKFRDSLKSEADIQVLVAGPAKCCSQKIHNQLAGLEAVPAKTDYVLFLDDDVELHSSTIGSFVKEMESKPETFLVTGYPLDIPSACLASFAAAAYHLPLSIVMASGGRSMFVWGGCMFFRATDLRADTHGIVSALRDGGYSDDMTVGGIVAANNRVALCPGYSLFLQRLPSKMTMLDVWMYLRRQVFTCMTYSSLPNLLINQLVMWLHAFLSFALVASTSRSLLVLVAQVMGYASADPLRWHPSSLDVAVTLLHLTCLIVCASCLTAALRCGIFLCSSLGGVDLTSKKFQMLLETSNPVKVWLGLLILNSMYIPCAIIAVFNPCIVWTGIKYVRKWGRVEVCSESH